MISMCHTYVMVTPVNDMLFEAGSMLELLHVLQHRESRQQQLS